MPSATPLGIPYPVATDPVSDGATAMQNIATWLDPKMRIAAGSVSIAIANANSGSASVTFPSGRFTTGPQVVATPVGAPTPFVAVSAGLSASGVTLWLRHVDNNTSTQNVTVRWIAIQAW
ncbi:MAG: hypothetical protein J2P16_14275 [Mycobacterium sp.]|nr:hypothetical protein [Mycobacterium sp.]